MEMLTRPGRRYRRFRYENQYDSPLLIFFADAAIMLAKLALLIAALLAVWVLADRMGNDPQASAAEVTQSSGQPATGQQVAVQPADTIITIEAAGTEAPAKAATSVKPDIVDAEWIASLNPQHFIVQFASTPDLNLLNELIPVINNNEEIAIYPFKKTRSGRPVYGIATGVFTDLDGALASLNDLSDEARAYDPWVRPVVELIKQIKSVQ